MKTPLSFLTGDLNAFRADPIGFLHQCYNKNGDNTHLRFGLQNCLFVTHPKDIHHVLAQNASNYDTDIKAYKQLQRVFGNGLLTSDESTWKKHRLIYQKHLSRAKIMEALGDITETIEHIIKNLNSTPINKPVDLHWQMNRLTLQVLDKTVLRAELTEIEMHTIKDSMWCISNYLVHQTRSMTSFFSFLPTEANKNFSQAVTNLRTITKRIIRLYKKGKGIPNGLIDELCQKIPDEKQLEDEVLTILISGHGTTAIALSWCCYLLAHHKEYMRQLATKLSAVFNNNPKDRAEKILKNTYLENIVFESLRLYPPVWRIIRRAKNDDQIGQTTIKAGSLVLISPLVTHKRDDVWETPELFKPGRFDSNQRPPGSFIPFGLGEHSCVGYHLAVIEIKLALAALINTFDIELSSPTPVEPLALLALPPKDPIFVKLIKR